MRREATVASLTVLTLLAGCIATPEDLGSASAETDSPLLDSLLAYESAYTYQGDAIVLRTDATPTGQTAAFWWEIPEGVILGDEDDDQWIEFLAAPVLLEEERASLERWMLMAFLAEEGTLALNSMAFGAPFTIGVDNGLDGATEEVERSLEPFHFVVGGKLRPGGRIGFVVSGIAAEDVELALVLLPLQEELDDEDDLPEDTEDFLALVEPASKVALPVAGTGGAHQLAFHYQGGSGLGGVAVTSGPVNIDGGSTNALVGNRRATVVWAEFPAGGYAISSTGYEAQSATGTWSAIADAHGAVSEDDGTLVAFLGPAILGWPYVVAMGEGDTPSQTSLTLETTSVLGDGLFLIQVDLDATLTDLLGLPALNLEGLTGSGAVERDGNDLTMTLRGATVRAVGLAQA